MTQGKRWITSATKEATGQKVQMPWARGARRAAFIAKRGATRAPSVARG